MKKAALFIAGPLLLAVCQAGALTIDIVAEASPYGYVALPTPNVTFTDESHVNFSVPTFWYAGETWDRIGMVSNGYAVVGGATAADVDYINSPLPDSGVPNNVLAPFWTDLNPDAGGNYYAYMLSSSGNSWVVMEWENAPNYGDGELNTFQIWIGLNGFEDIWFNYGPVLSDGDGGFLTIGAEDVTGTVGAMYYFDGTGTLPRPGSSLHVVTEGNPVLVPEPATLGLLAFALVGLTVHRRFSKS